MQVRRADAPVELKGAKRGRILAVLAAECGRPVSIDRLVTALWTDPPKTATKTVRVQVGEIRRRLQADDGEADPIVTRPGGYQLEVAPHQVDLHRFVALVRQGGELLRSGAAEQAGDRYRDALALWQEPPLPSLADDPTFSPLVAEVEGLALAAREGTLLTRLELRQHRPLLAEVDALLAREPLREELYAIAMLALYREGRQADALALYQRARGVLADELGVEPSERLRDLELAILDQRDDLLDESDSRAIGRFSTTGSFVGRSRELVALGDAWERAQRGRGSIVLVTGEPGVGKTRLAHELADQLHAAGAAQAWANAAATATAPLGAVASWLEQLGALDAAADQATGAARQQLSVLPDDDPELDSGRGRHQRLIDAVISALREVSARRAVLLVLDDLHQADHATAALLLQLGQVIDHLPVLVVGTQRSTEADQGPGLAAVLPELLRIDAAQRLPLAPLDREETARYLAAVLGGAPHDDVVEAVWHRAAGNVLFTVELAALYHDSGGSPAALGELPDALHEYVRSRLEGLDAVARAAVEAAAVLGTDFSSSLVGAVIGEGADPPDLEPLTGRRLLAQPAPDRYRFVHDLVRDAVYEILPGERRRALHLRAARALEGHALRDPAALDEVAHHRMATLPDEAGPCVDACLAAARRAISLAAFADAARWCDLAVRACSHLPADTGRLLAAELAYGEALMRAGDRDARPHLDVALEAARATGDGAALARAAYFCAADCIPTPTDDPVTVAVLEEANRALGSEDSELKVRILDFLSLANYREPGNAAVDFADEAVRRAERRGDPRVLALAYNGRAMAAAGPDDIDERLALAALGIESARRAPDAESVIVGRVLRLMALLELGRVTDADAELDLVERAATERREPRFLWMAAGWQGLRALRRGHLDDAEQRFGEGLEVWRHRPTRDALVGYGIQTVALRLLQGRAAEVLPMVQGAGVEAGGGPAWLAVRALTAAEAGDGGDARQALADCLGSGPNEWPRDLTWALAVSMSAEAASLLGDVAAAGALAPLVAPLVDRHVVLTAFGAGGIYWGCLAHPAGLLAALLGERERARALLGGAVDEHTRIGAIPFAERSTRALDAL